MFGHSIDINSSGLSCWKLQPGIVSSCKRIVQVDYELVKTISSHLESHAVIFQNNVFYHLGLNVWHMIMQRLEHQPKQNQ